MSDPHSIRTLTSLAIFIASAALARAADERPPVDYLSDVAPILRKHCADCHGEKKQEANLRLDLGAAILTGGDSGPALVPGDGKTSLLIRRLTGEDGLDRMPPEGRGLDKDEVDTLRFWIDSGAAHPANEIAKTNQGPHWAFQPISVTGRAEHPTSSSVRNQIDPLIQRRLDEASKTLGRSMTMSASAAPELLLRRLSLDLRGLPPGPDELDELRSDEHPDLWERWVDRMLASASFGERWGRWWLDQARYADSNGYTRDFGREIWPYREWVIQALNADLAFDQFTIEQLAGDLLPDATQAQQVATGFHRNTLVNEEGGTDQEQFRIEAVADRVATTGSVWLGLTVGCARCHNHKYDPISQREFYQLFAFLNNCDEPSIEAPTQLNLEHGDIPRRDAIRKQIADLESQVEQNRAELEAAQQKWEKEITPEQRARLPGPVQVAYDMAFEKRDAMNKKLIEDFYRVSTQGRESFPLLDQIARLRESEPKIPSTLVLRERDNPRETHLHKRGDFLNRGVQVTPSTLAILPPLQNQSNPSPNRLHLARWLVDSRNPLTPRVIANRVWLQFFGRGIVETDDDFGTQGTPPTHPELLDSLAGDLLGLSTNSPWSLKRFQRRVVLSAVYRQSSNRRADLDECDPRNDLLARQARLRVDAEIVRDLALAASGLLTQRIGGPSVMPPQPEGVYAFTQDPKPWNAETGGNRFRRGIYTFFWRSLPFPMLSIFDAPNANVTCTRRLRSNTPLQSLMLANDLGFVECAQQLARRVLAESSSEMSERTIYMFRLCLARDPSSIERERLVELVKQQLASFADDVETARRNGTADRSEDTTEFEAWTAVSRVILNLDEFITRE